MVGEPFRPTSHIAAMIFYLRSHHISPTYPWKIPRTLQQQFLKEFLSMYGKVWGYFPRVCGQNHQFLHLIFGLITVDRHIGPRSTDRMAGWDGILPIFYDLDPTCFYVYEKNHVMIRNILSLKIMEDPNVYYVRSINILILNCSHVTSATFPIWRGQYPGWVGTFIEAS